jgi:hypothetical protein
VQLSSGRTVGTLETCCRRWQCVSRLSGQQFWLVLQEVTSCDFEGVVCTVWEHWSGKGLLQQQEESEEVAVRPHPTTGRGTVLKNKM